MERCPTCVGVGKVGCHHCGSIVECESCVGGGQVVRHQCGMCGGSGVFGHGMCKGCNGQGDTLGPPKPAKGT